MTVRPTEARTRVGGVALGAAFLLVAFNLRPALAAVSPILPAIRAADGLSSAAAGVLTSMPLVCFGVAAFFTPRLVHRRGTNMVMLACLVALAVGTALRSVPDLAALFGATFVLGMSIGICNVVMPAIVKRDFPGRVALMTGLYTTMLSLGPSAGSGLTVPLEHAIGGSWRLALGAWAALSVVAALCWLPFRRRDDPAVPLDRPPSKFWRHRVWRSGFAWSITLYMSLQALNFYTVLTWLPTILQSRGASVLGAGALLAALNAVAVIAALLAPAVSQRLGSPWAVAVGAAAANAAGTVGLIADGSHLEVLWAMCIGVGQGAAISLAMMMIVVRSADSDEATALSGMAQGVGYLVAAGGPVLAGVLFDASGGWDLPLTALLGFLVLQMAAGWWGGRRPTTGSKDAALATLEPWS